MDDGRYRVLVVADEQCATPSFASRAAVPRRRPTAIDLRGVTRTGVEGRTPRGDQKGYDDATRRLNDIVEGMQRVDIEARGEVGPNDPLQAADDGLRQFAANEIVFVTNPKGQANWLETGVVETAKSRYSQPVTHITVAER